ncbi:hypothetical protein DFH27DRAFT_521352 [Peziza echinospora]|nr:hypothetical protein DFH27DRAFT_521352 [Peziza echinospora]
MPLRWTKTPPSGAGSSGRQLLFFCVQQPPLLLSHRPAAAAAAAASARIRLFTSSPPRASTYSNGEVTYYDLLKLPNTASPGEIKRRYYELSKAHHPDRNPNDPEASARFSRLSEAYATIGNPQKREKYDKELVRKHGIPHYRGANGEAYGPAGGRPASGLSRRRTQFRGPPPSFFRNTGWAAAGGNAAAAGGGAKDAASAAAGGSTNYHAGNAAFFRAQGGRNDDVPHFDFERHRSQQDRVRRKPTKAEFPFIPDGIMFPLVAVASMLLIAVGISSSDSKGMDKARNSDQRK